MASILNIIANPSETYFAKPFHQFREKDGNTKVSRSRQQSYGITCRDGGNEQQNYKIFERLHMF
jgi:hypothetical protein